MDDRLIKRNAGRRKSLMETQQKSQVMKLLSDWRKTPRSIAQEVHVMHTHTDVYIDA